MSSLSMHRAVALVCLLAALLAASPLRAELAAPLPPQPEGTPWPDGGWPRNPTPPALEAIFTRILGETEDPHLAGIRALLVVKDGRIAGEAYRAGFSETTRFPSWSMAKSVVHALTGILAGEGRLDIGAPAPVPEWQRHTEDRRAAITVEHLLRMQSGLSFAEVYDDPSKSHVLQMLFGIGRKDMAHYAASLRLIHTPGSHWSYSSGTSNILARILKEAAGAPDAAAMNAVMQEKLFRPIGIESAVPEFDAAGTFIGSSFVHMTAQDWARFGYLYLRDGKWGTERLLPEGWADHARRPARHSGGRYGAHFWLNAADPETGRPAISDRIPVDMFMARGFGAQLVMILPSRDMVVVLLGVNYTADPEPLVALVADIIEAAGNP
ncbi:serine hydrolase [uncultured Parvibaculum sp.]|uniref:serine hydrolase domain-containing protein n=1 Tax=uncultured Parvibaculum sp. TaxID=291828 RepID=UPI0030DB5D48